MPIFARLLTRIIEVKQCLPLLKRTHKWRSSKETVMTTNTDTQQRLVRLDVAKMVEQLSDFDYSDYNEHIESLIDTQLNPK